MLAVPPVHAPARPPKSFQASAGSHRWTSQKLSVPPSTIPRLPTSINATPRPITEMAALRSTEISISTKKLGSATSESAS